MSVTSGFFNSLSGDRKYDAIQISAMFDGLITDGIYNGYLESFMVTASSPASMVVTVGEGRCWFNHTWTLNDAPLPLTLDVGDVVLNRIDTIVIDVDSTDTVRACTIKVIKGTPSSQAVRPTLENTETHHQYPLCDISVPAGATTVTQSNITNRRGTSDCPFVATLMESVDVDDLLIQWESQWNDWMTDRANAMDSWTAEQQSAFTTWFETVQDILDQDTAGNLLNRINHRTGINATATYSAGVVAITAPDDAGEILTFVAPSDFLSTDTYTLNGEALTITDLNGEALDDSWKKNSPVTITVSGGKAFFKAGGMGKLPSDLAPLCPNFTVERNGTKVKISADKIQLNGYTNMVSGGVWAWGKTRPTKPTGENTKQWSRAELITTGKPYDGLYLGDVTPSDAVTETLIYLPENDGGSVKLVPFIVLSTDYLGGVYVVRKFVWDASVFGVESVDSYDGSTLDTFMQSYANSVISDEILNEIVEVNYSIFSVSLSGNKTVKRKVITVSAGECNMEGFTDGNKIPRFSTPANRIAYDESGQVRAYWTRTKQNASSSIGVNPSGNFIGYTPTFSEYTRPSFVLPKDFQIQQRPDGSYTVWNEQGLMTLGDIEASDNGVETIVNIPTTSGLNAVRYTMKTYNEQDVGLMEYRNSVGSSNYSPNDRSKLLFEASNLYSTLVSTMDSAFSDSLKTLIPSVNVKLTRNSGSVEDVSLKYFILSLTEIGAELGNGKVEGTLVPWYADPTKKAARGNGFTRTINMGGSYYTAYCTNTSGNTFANPPDYTHVIWPVFCLPLTAPVRALADGTYDLVPEDPALSAQSISTLADEEEVPLEIELDWPESDPLIARQWVYNEKGVYQTMLLGGIASTEDAPAYSPVLSENTWEQIAQACADRDPILDSWLVGDEKDEVINRKTLTFVIVGKDHDDKSDGSGKAPLTFGMKNLMAEIRQMNSSNTNAGSFAGSAMYSWLSGTIYPNLPTELKDAIKAVNKKTSSGGGSSAIRTDSMYLWLFAEIEVFGTTAYSYAGEGTQYPYFATAAERIKRLSNGSGAASHWWERSPFRNSSNSFCFVGTSGSANNSYANFSRGVCFGFCI